MPQFLNNLNLTQNELQNAVIQNYAGNPDTVLSGIQGQIVYSTTLDALFVNTDSSTAWDRLSAAAGTVTSVTAGNAITVTGTSTDPVVNHADTSTQASVANSGETYIQDITLDTYGHVTGIESGTSGNDNYGSWVAAGDTGSDSVTSGQTLTFAGGTNVTTSVSGTTLTINATDTNTTYSAGTGLDLTGTTFSLSHLGIESLVDPNADRILFWDDSAGSAEWLSLGTNLSITGTTLNATDTNTVTNAFTTIQISGQSDVVADSTADTLTLVAGSNVTLTTNATTDTITIASTDTNSIDYVNAASFNTSNGELTLSGVGNAGAVVDLDGRYLTSYVETQTLDDVTGLGNSTANSITVGGLTVNGDLTVSGAHTVVLAEEVQVEDSIFVLNSNEAGTPSQDAGFVIERGTSTNVGVLWDESADQFVFVTSAETGTTAGDVTISDYADVRLGGLTVDDTLNLGTVVNAGVDTDKFLVLDSSGNVDFRTGAEVRSDIGAGTGNGTMSSFNIDADSGTSNSITNGETFSIVGGGDVTTSVATNQVTVSFTETYTAHDNIAAASDETNSGITYVQSLDFDSNGHVLGVTSTAVRAATTSQTGVVELATNAEASTGTSTTLAVTPDGLDQFRADREAVFTISGDASTTAFALTHNFGTRMVMAEVVDYGDAGTGATYETVYPDVTRSDDNNVTVTFGSAPSATQDYRVMLRVIA